MIQKSDQSPTQSLQIEPGKTREIGKNYRDVVFAFGIVTILCLLFLPLPAFIIDFGLSISIALSVLILMVALWVQRPLDFSAFPTVLLVATLLRLALNVATTRLILAHGSEGTHAAGHVIAGFATLVMGGDFVIGVVVFSILVTVNFIVITKGATRIAEVGARFTLDAIPGKQMAIDADLSAGLIDEKAAQARRKELEEESSFFGSMDGASKFVRGDAIAGLIILAVNIIGGVIIGVLRHDMPIGEAIDIFTKLSVGDGLVSQVPALIVSFAAGLIVSKGGARGAAEQAVTGQLSNYPRAMAISSFLLFVLALVPGLPLLPFSGIGAILLYGSYALSRDTIDQDDTPIAPQSQVANNVAIQRDLFLKEALKTFEIELCFGTQLSTGLLSARDEIAHRVAKMRRKFALQYGFVVPEVRLSDSLSLPPQGYEIKLHGVSLATDSVRPGEMLVVVEDGMKLDYPSVQVREPAFGMDAAWVSETFAIELRAAGYKPIDVLSVILTHLNETIKSNLSQLLSYKDTRILLDAIEPEYKKLLDDICPSHITYSGLQATLKALLAERVSIRNLPLILEGIAEIIPHMRRTEQVVEHIRLRLSQQICGDIAINQTLPILRLGGRWDLAFHEALKRDSKGDVIQFDFDPRSLEEFGQELSRSARPYIDGGDRFAIVCAVDARPYVRMVVERLFPSIPVLSHIELSRNVKIKTLGSIS